MTCHPLATYQLNNISIQFPYSTAIRLRHEYDMLRRLYHGYPKGYKLNGIPKVRKNENNILIGSACFLIITDYKSI